ncbi:MAG: hypothetical protein PF588_01700 [Candidatus Kapabacteria bacterium]|jgi:hypothetical protein|nr:hypothetical protein [Candidatus Kapabacteria bacterium]
MKKLILVLALVFTAGFFACSELPNDMNSADVEIVSSDNGSGSIAMYPQIILISFSGGSSYAPESGYDDLDIDKKGTTISSYLNDCLTAGTLDLYVKCIKRKVKFLILKGFLTAEEGVLIIQWAEDQPV